MQSFLPFIYLFIFFGGGGGGGGGGAGGQGLVWKPKLLYKF